MQIRRQRPRTAANGFEKQDEASEAFKDIIIKYNIINDMTRHKLSGAGAAIPTPFTPDGRVDYPALARTIDYIIDGGVDFIVALGTTAETPTLYLHERAVVAMFIKNHIAGRVPLVIGVGGNSTSEVLDQLREFDLRGADAILSVTPYYNKPSQEGLYQHFKTVSEHSPLPIILYNVPGRTGVNMTAATTIRIAGDFPNSPSRPAGRAILPGSAGRFCRRWRNLHAAARKKRANLPPPDRNLQKKFGFLQKNASKIAADVLE